MAAITPAEVPACQGIHHPLLCHQSHSRTGSHRGGQPLWSTLCPTRERKPQKTAPSCISALGSTRLYGTLAEWRAVVCSRAPCLLVGANLPPKTVTWLSSRSPFHPSPAHTQHPCTNSPQGIHTEAEPRVFSPHWSRGSSQGRHGAALPAGNSSPLQGCLQILFCQDYTSHFLKAG